MADITSAGTLVAAVLETAGYLTQEEFLNTFHEFFRTGGALCYIIAGIGGIISVALFGSYRAANYLLLGPALFWMAVGPWAPTDGAVWKMGGGRPRLIDGTFPSGDDRAQAALAAAQVKDAALESLSSLASSAPAESRKETARISWFFKFYTSSINSIVASIVNLILPHENDEDLLFIARTKALDALVASQVSAGPTAAVASDALIKCETMMAAALTFASPTASPAEVERLKASKAQHEVGTYPVSFEVIERCWLGFSTCKRDEVRYVVNSADRMQALIEGEQIRLIEEKQALLRQTLAEAEQLRMTPSPATRTFITDWAETHPHDPNRFNQLINRESWSCRELREVLSAAVWDESLKLWQEIQETFDPAEYQKRAARMNTPGAAHVRATSEHLLCKALWEKFDSSVDAEAACRSGGLAPIASIYLLRNLIAQLPQSGVIQRHENRAALLKGQNRKIELLNFPGERAEQSGVKVLRDESGSAFTRFSRSANGLTRLEVKVSRTNGKGQKEEGWEPYASIGEVPGMRSAAFGFHQNYQSAGLRQQIFTWALQLPYWQGVLLYLLAVSYPFLALVLLIPGRAQVFSALPLAWLWVKSWDIGFASVMILDKVLWNMLPHSTGLSAKGLDKAELLSTLVEAMRVDPTYNVHAYYLLLSLSLFSVPVLTGYVTLKARRSILSSFVDAPKEAASDAMTRASGAYGVGVMNQNLQQSREIAGLAYTMQGDRGKGLWNERRLAWVAGSGLVAAGGEFAGDVIQNTGKGHPIYEKGPDGNDVNTGRRNYKGNRERSKKHGYQNQLAKDALDSAAGGIKAASRELKNIVMHDAAFDAAFEPVFGRWGRNQMMLDATNAAMDGGGGYEINDVDGSDQAYKKLIELYRGRVETGFDAISEIISGIAGRLGQPGGKGENDGEGKLTKEEKAQREIEQRLLHWLGTLGLMQVTHGRGEEDDWYTGVSNWFYKGLRHYRDRMEFDD